MSQEFYDKSLDHDKYDQNNNKFTSFDTTHVYCLICNTKSTSKDEKHNCELRREKPDIIVSSNISSQ